MEALWVAAAVGGLLAGACAVPPEDQVQESEQVNPDGQDQADEADHTFRVPRGLACRRTCEDRHAEEMRDCAKLPAGFLRRGCEDRARWLYRMCLKFCQKGPRSCLDDGDLDAMSPECTAPSQSES